MAKKQGQSKPSPVLAMLLAWLVPGLGHVYLGRTVRGIILFVAISATFWAGIAIGGVMTVDRQNEGWWFAAEMFTGANGLVAWQKQRGVYGKLVSSEDIIGDIPHDYNREAWQAVRIDKKLADEGIALVVPVGTVARAYAGVAGMLNLMCIFDAFILAAMGVTGELKPPAGGGREEAAQP